MAAVAGYIFGLILEVMGYTLHEPIDYVIIILAGMAIGFSVSKIYYDRR